MSVAQDGRSTRWESHRRERREAVLATAVALIDRHGPELDVHALSAATPIPRSTLYRLFRDLAELEEEVRHAIVLDLLDAVPIDVRPDDSVASFVRRTARTYVAWVGAHPNLQRFMTGRSTEPGDSPASAAVARGRKAFLELVRQAGHALLEVDPDQADAATTRTITRAAYAISGLTERVVVDHDLAAGDIVEHPDSLAGFLTEAICAIYVAAGRTIGRTLDPDQPIGSSQPSGRSRLGSFETTSR